METSSVETLASFHSVRGTNLLTDLEKNYKFEMEPVALTGFYIERTPSNVKPLVGRFHSSIG